MSSRVSLGLNQPGALSQRRAPHRRPFVGTIGPGTTRAKLPKTTSLGKGNEAPADQAPANRLVNKSSHIGSPPFREGHRPIGLSLSPSGATSTKGGWVRTLDSGPWPRVRKARDWEGSGTGPSAQTPPTPPLPASQNPKTPQRTSAWLVRWTPPIFPVDLPLKDIYCLREIPVAARLMYLLPF